MVRTGKAEGDFGDGSDVGESPFFFRNSWEAARLESGDGGLAQPLEPRIGGKRRFLLEVAEVAHVARGFFG